MRNDPTKIAQHSAQPGAEKSQLALHPPKLLGVSVTARPDGRGLGHTHVALTQADATALGRLGQLDDCLVEQVRVGRIGDVLLLHRRIDVHLLQFLWRDLFFTQRQSNGLLQEHGELIRADPFAPLGLRGRVQRQFVLHGREAAKTLPIGILHPTRDQRLVGFIEGVFQVVQADEQSRCLGRRAHVVRVELGKRRVKTRLIDLLCQDHQRMVWIKQLVEVGAKQIELVVIALRTWSHGSPKLQETEDVVVNILQILLDRPHRSTPSLPGNTHNFKDDHASRRDYANNTLLRLLYVVLRQKRFVSRMFSSSKRAAGRLAHGGYHDMGHLLLACRLYRTVSDHGFWSLGMIIVEANVINVYRCQWIADFCKICRSVDAVKITLLQNDAAGE